MITNSPQTIEDLADDLIRERSDFKAGLVERGDLLASANHVGKILKATSLMLANAAMRGEVPKFAILSNRAGEGSGAAPNAKRLSETETLALANGLNKDDSD